jgi:MoaA/NifB/PqqE/SkfB family radical SAM enzyme
VKEQLVEWDPATGVVHTPPQQFFLELTKRCNMTCVQCTRDYGAPWAGKEPDLSWEAIERLMPWLHRARFVNLNIVGEPLLARHFDRTVAELARGQCQVNFNTNGLLLTEQRCRKLIEQGVWSVAISIDGMHSNQAIRGVPWEAIVERVLLFDRIKREMGAERPYLALSYTLMKRNLEELPVLLRHVLPRAKIDAVHVQPLLVFYETTRGENVYAANDVDRLVATCREICSAHDSRLVLFRSGFNEDERSRKDTLRELGPASETLGCSDPFFEVKIYSDGTLNACAFGRSPGFDIERDDFGEIWNGPWYRELRLALAARRFEGECATCPYVNGCELHQLTPLRPGTRHSQEARFLRDRAHEAAP